MTIPCEVTPVRAGATISSYLEQVPNMFRTSSAHVPHKFSNVGIRMSPMFIPSRVEGREKSFVREQDEKT